MKPQNQRKFISAAVKAQCRNRYVMVAISRVVIKVAIIAKVKSQQFELMELGNCLMVNTSKCDGLALLLAEFYTS
jgi:hypothetical protein